MSRKKHPKEEKTADPTLGKGSPGTTALQDALEILYAGVHLGAIKRLPREEYGQELKRVRTLQRIVAKAIAEGNVPRSAARPLARHFDALIEAL